MTEGKRIKDVVSQQTVFNPDLKILVDHDSFALTAKAMKLGLLGNTYIQGSSDNGQTFHNILLPQDTVFRVSSDGGTTWIILDADKIAPTAERLYLTQAILDEIQENINFRHQHSNMTLLESLISSGDGNSFLSNDGTYKEAMKKETYDANNDGVVDNAEKLGNQEPNYYLSRENHTGVIHNHTKGLSVSYPTDFEKIVLFHTDVEITIVEINAIIKGVAPSIRVNFVHTQDVSLNGTSLLISPVDVINSTTGQSLPLSNVTIPANSWIVFKTLAKSGTVDEICVSIAYDIN